MLSKSVEAMRGQFRAMLTASVDGGALSASWSSTGTAQTFKSLHPTTADGTGLDDDDPARARELARAEEVRQLATQVSTVQQELWHAFETAQAEHSKYVAVPPLLVLAVFDMFLVCGATTALQGVGGAQERA